MIYFQMYFFLSQDAATPGLSNKMSTLVFLPNEELKMHSQFPIFKKKYSCSLKKTITILKLIFMLWMTSRVNPIELNKASLRVTRLSQAISQDNIMIFLAPKRSDITGIPTHQEEKRSVGLPDLKTEPGDAPVQCREPRSGNHVPWQRWRESSWAGVCLYDTWMKTKQLFAHTSKKKIFETACGSSNTVQQETDVHETSPLLWLFGYLWT